jgi:spore coat-associated protein N
MSTTSTGKRRADRPARQTHRHTHRHTTRFVAKILATVALVAGAGAVAGVGTFGAYTDTTTADMTVGSGKVSVLMNGGDNGIHVDAKNMVPGDKVVFPVSIKRETGSVELGDLTLQTTITNQNALTDALRLSVDSCSVPWTVSGSTVTCTGGTTTTVSTDGGLVGNGATSAWGETSSWLPALNASNNGVYLRATLSLPSSASSSTQGLTTGVTWKLIGTQRTAKTTVVTPSAL